MPTSSGTLRAAVRVLLKHYGPPAPPATSDPFELILWENVAYLAPPARRGDAFAELKRTIGTAPAAILKATKVDLERITSRGILKSTFAGKLRKCARIAVDKFGGDLGAAIQGPLESAKRALRAFPGIGEPGAERILLFAGRLATLAPESNGLRVLVRLGLVTEGRSYSQTYAASREVAETLPAKPSVMQEAHLLLQQHGRTLCKRKAPLCDACPLAPSCVYALGRHGASGKGPQPKRVQRGTAAKPARFL